MEPKRKEERKEEREGKRGKVDNKNNGKQATEKRNRNVS